MQPQNTLTLSRKVDECKPLPHAPPRAVPPLHHHHAIGPARYRPPTRHRTPTTRLTRNSRVRHELDDVAWRASSGGLHHAVPQRHELPRRREPRQPRARGDHSYTSKLNVSTVLVGYDRWLQRQERLRS